ncbi:BrnT family toxin [Candidatus Roizmanbacteria bacterium]|nr:BrnT family toxin [Candidatus Roizmanbacteria bacterium]
MKIYDKAIVFDWDVGNIDKNLKHGVNDKESEEVFGSQKKVVTKDATHSLAENRYMIWGVTNKGRTLSIFFTLRKNKVRIISARDMSRKERKTYHEKI